MPETQEAFLKTVVKKYTEEEQLNLRVKAGWATEDKMRDVMKFRE